MGLKNKVVLKCENVCLDIPVVSKTELTFKKKFIRSITGGQVSSKKGTTTIKALSNLNLTIYTGQRIALIGHNGSGKSSFIRLISGIYTPTSGILKVQQIFIHFFKIISGFPFSYWDRCSKSSLSAYKK